MQRRFNPATETWYNYSYVQDGLGHTRLLLDGSGNIVNRYAYDAWGTGYEPEQNPLRGKTRSMNISLKRNPTYRS